MTQVLLLDAEKIKQRLQIIFQRKRREWIAGQGQWPLVIPLGLPDQKTALNNKAAVADWINHWRRWCGVGELRWCWRDWPVLGRQELPEKFIFSQAAQVMQWLDQSATWQQAVQRYQCLTELWPQVQHPAVKYHELLAEYSAEDFISLQTVLTWLLRHPHSQLYVRQLPIAGVDTKWLESRRSLIIAFLQAIRNVDTTDFYELTGLKREPNLIRLRILDKKLRSQFGGISDWSVSALELAQLNFSVKRVYIVENLRTGLAFADLPDAVVFMGLGNSVNQLAVIPWVQSAECYYWGDLDTHGFAILNRVRAHLPAIKSVLMDEQTLLNSKSLWVVEPQPYRSENLDFLTADEKKVYMHLLNNTWGYQIRLEQERIFWEYAWQAVTQL